MDLAQHTGDLATVKTVVSIEKSRPMKVNFRVESKSITFIIKGKSLVTNMPTEQTDSTTI